ncbi:hypothetical protein EDC01DRAFT_636575 [Geopyxis carbonaria]|nr:hypothetical protein EDC01DRAFT_636575 [Geopyxis carbonaria]
MANASVTTYCAHVAISGLCIYFEFHIPAPPTPTAISAPPLVFLHDVSGFMFGASAKIPLSFLLRDKYKLSFSNSVYCCEDTVPLSTCSELNTLSEPESNPASNPSRKTVELRRFHRLCGAHHLSLYHTVYAALLQYSLGRLRCENTSRIKNNVVSTFATTVAKKPSTYKKGADPTTPRRRAMRGLVSSNNRLPHAAPYLVTISHYMPSTPTNSLSPRLPEPVDEDFGARV